ncbi:hypothetical protein HNR10_000727 [Nocardiopsis aegyptia]|uniref:Uncharacterized protein n=1 Tax=Nocardiopsis aegyptia TaxID=220378 RepID=A0A7Z0EIX3_9ACTN|nr:hypothetical protein [Nocardiopsis aegyptia]
MGAAAGGQRRVRGGGPLIRSGTRNDVTRFRQAFAATRWRAAQHDLVLDRTQGLLGSVYTLTSLKGRPAILYDLGEVHAHLDRLAMSRS